MLNGDNLRRLTSISLVIILIGSACLSIHTGPQKITIADWGQVLTSYHGSFLVVYVWTGWCRSCVEALPHLKEIQRQYQSEGLYFVSLSLDDENDIEAINQTLRETRIDGEYYLLRGDFSELIDKIDIRSVPSILIYNRDGRRLVTLSDDRLENKFFLENLESSLEAIARDGEI